MHSSRSTRPRSLPRPEGRPLQVLIHGDPGALSAGLVGTAINGLDAACRRGPGVRVWVTETRPYLEGARLATWELANAGIEHTLLRRLGASRALLEAETIDAVLLGAEWIAANGDTANVVGSRAVAELAATAPGGPLPVYVCTPITTFDPTMPDGAAIPRDLRPARELGTVSHRCAGRSAARLQPGDRRDPGRSDHRLRDRDGRPSADRPRGAPDSARGTPARRGVAASIVPEVATQGQTP